MVICKALNCLQSSDCRLVLNDPTHQQLLHPDQIHEAWKWRWLIYHSFAEKFLPKYYNLQLCREMNVCPWVVTSTKNVCPWDVTSTKNVRPWVVGCPINKECMPLGCHINKECMPLGCHINKECTPLGCHINKECTPLGCPINKECMPLGCHINKEWNLTFHWPASSSIRNSYMMSGQISVKRVCVCVSLGLKEPSLHCLRTGPLHYASGSAIKKG